MSNKNPVYEKSPRIPVTINKSIEHTFLKPTRGSISAYVKHIEEKIKPVNKTTFENSSISDNNTIESPMGKQDNTEPLEEFAHPIINEKEDSGNKVEKVISVLVNEEREVQGNIIVKPENDQVAHNPNPLISEVYQSQLDKDDLKQKPATKNTPSETLKDRTNSEDEMIRETVKLFLSDDNDEHPEHFVLPGQTDIAEHIETYITSYKEKNNLPPKSDIIINNGLITITTVNTIVKVRANKLIGYIVGKESIILIFKKNNITVPIKNSAQFKTIIVYLEEIMTKRACCFWPF
jgi:hypothetical protein